MKQLILGQIPDDFNPNIHIPVSPSCFIGKEDIYPEFENLEYVSIINSRTDIRKYDILTTNEALYWVNRIAKKYNADVFSQHSFQFWETIYFPWLGLVIPWLYRKQLLAEKLIEKYDKEPIQIPIFNNIEILVKDELSFIVDVIWNLNVNAWILSSILKNKKPDCWDTIKKEIETTSDIKTLKKFHKKTWKTTINNILNSMFNRSNSIYGFNKIDDIFFHLLLSFKKPVHLDRDNYAERLNTNFIQWDFDIEGLLDFLIPESLRKLNLRDNKRKYNPGRIINYSNRLYYIIEMKKDAAFAYENNAIVTATQHGGHNYGTAYSFNFGEEVEFKSDIFISWGWGGEKKNILPLPSPLLSKKFNSYKKSNDQILLVGTDIAGFQSRFDSSPNDNMFIVYRKYKIQFIKNLRKNILDKFYYRPYPEKQTSFLDSKYILKHFQNINIHKGNLHKDMQECNLLVLDHPGTTWNIAMAMNTPLILFWNRDHFPFNKKADEYLDRFKVLGIYFEDPQQAVEKVNDLNAKYDDLSVWWNQKDIQNLRKEWMNEYARADKNWFWIWTKTLWNLK